MVSFGLKLKCKASIFLTIEMPESPVCLKKSSGLCRPSWKMVKFCLCLKL